MRACHPDPERDELKAASIGICRSVIVYRESVPERRRVLPDTFKGGIS